MRPLVSFTRNGLLRFYLSRRIPKWHTTCKSYPDSVMKYALT